MISRIALEGIDGSGKTSVAEALAENLRNDGLQVMVAAPYRLANIALGHDVYSLWSCEETRPKAVELLKGAIEDVEKEATQQSMDVVIYDRHWMTAFTEISSDLTATDLWGDNFVPAALLCVSPAVAQRRLGRETDEAWATILAQGEYAQKYALLARQYPTRMLGMYRSSEDVTIDSLVRIIRWDMNIQR